MIATQITGKRVHLYSVLFRWLRLGNTSLTLGPIPMATVVTFVMLFRLLAAIMVRSSSFDLPSVKTMTYFRMFCLACLAENNSWICLEFLPNNSEIVIQTNVFI